jgi:riboflavin kinase/FMN adenylyltransferase
LKIYHHIDEFEPLEYAVATTGTFDGVHVGHRTILNKLTETAKNNKGESVLFTFHPHPRMVLQPDLDLSLINSLEEKAELLKECGLDHLIIHPFTKEFSRTSSLEFVRNILVKSIGVKKLVIGYDHHFGRNREGSFEHLKEFGPVYGFDVEEIPAQDVNEVKVSSTKIRKALLEGEIKIANDYLTRPYRLTGFVVKGDQLGRKINFPTANIKLDDEKKLIPKDGAYAVQVRIDNGKDLKIGMCNIGYRPTVKGKTKTIEVHLLDFKEEIYGSKLTLFFADRLRNEIKFNSLEELKSQLKKDEVKCRSILA